MRVDSVERQPSSGANGGETLTIGALAKAAEVGVETIRYYQRRQLLPVPKSAGNSYRHYPVQLVERIRFIKRAQTLGFSLTDIGALLQLDDGDDRRSVRHLARSRLESVRAKIADLTQIETALAQLVHECEHSAEARSCPILAAFSGQTDAASKGER